MAIFSKELCKQRLALWLEAEAAVATGQSYTIDDRSLTRASLKQIREQIEFWSGRLATIENEEKQGGSIRAFQFVPRDV